MRNKRLIIILLLIFWALSLFLAARSVNVIHAPASVKGLETGWDWAFKTADKEDVKKGFYIGYAIEREKNGRVCQGRYKYHRDKTLYEILYGRKAGKEQLDRLENQVAILFRYDNRPSHRFDFQEIKLNNLDHPIEINNIPIFWLGLIRIEESITYLGKCFFSKYTDSDKEKETLVTAVGIHGPHPKAFGFLKEVLTGNDAAKIRKSAVFWISQQQNSEAAKVLEHTVYNDRSSAVRENAVFGLYLVTCKEADDALVKLAKKGKDKHLRKKAIFWLGQKAVKRTAEILEDMVNVDTDTDIQKAAVFAISQHPDGVSRLIKIARTHRSLNVRKQAIFWLSQSDDPQALDTILDIIEN